MSNSVEHPIPTNCESPVESVSETRFDRFTESERCLLSEALKELLQVKQEAMEIANEDLGSNPSSHFSEADFGIPAIEHIIDELEA